MHPNPIRQNWLFETVQVFQAAAAVRVSPGDGPTDAAQIAAPSPATPLERLVLDLLRLRWSVEATRPCLTQPTTTAYTRLVHQAIQLIEEKYAESLSYESIGRQLRCDAEHLERCFHRMTGTTLHRQIRRVRIDRAGAAIAKGVKVEAVALIVGYRTKSGFLRAFRQEYGMTPVQFRRAASHVDQGSIVVQPVPVSPSASDSIPLRQIPP